MPDPLHGDRCVPTVIKRMVPMWMIRRHFRCIIWQERMRGPEGQLTARQERRFIPGITLLQPIIIPRPGVAALPSRRHGERQKEVITRCDFRRTVRMWDRDCQARCAFMTLSRAAKKPMIPGMTGTDGV